MGRTIAPYRWIFEEEKRFWEKRLQKTGYKVLGKELLSGSAYYNDAGSNWGIGQVRDKVCFMILFFQYKELLQLEQKDKSLK